MRIVVTELVVGICDLTGKENVECLKLQLDDNSAELLCSPKEFIKLLRLRKKQDGGNKSPEKKGM